MEEKKQKQSNQIGRKNTKITKERGSIQKNQKK